MNDWRTVAPRVPMRKPRMLVTMIMAAVNSIFRPCLMQMMRERAMVRIVRSSSSSIPADRQLRATTA